ncbi:MAG: GntR family transcriptional regulator [Pseudomonadota bacterium]
MVAVTPQSLPKSVQVSEMLIREIKSGRLADGDRLPTERQMARDLGIAVGTLRKALAVLDDRGLLKRIQGSGNYIQAQEDIESVYSFFHLELLAGGGLPSARVVDVLCLFKPGDLPFIGDDRKAHRIRRIRSLNGQPVALEEIWLDLRFCQRLKREDLNESLYLHYKERLGLVIGRIEDRIGVSLVPDWAPAVLGIPAGNPCGFVERTSFDQNGTRAEYSRTWFDQTAARYTVRK